MHAQFSLIYIVAVLGQPCTRFCVIFTHIIRQKGKYTKHKTLQFKCSQSFKQEHKKKEIR